jgi:hypothetical protein
LVECVERVHHCPVSSQPSLHYQAPEAEHDGDVDTPVCGRANYRCSAAGVLLCLAVVV